MKIYAVLALVFALALMPAQAQAYYGASLDIVSDAHNVCPCDIISSDEIVLELTNYGTKTDTFFIDMAVPDGWTGFIVPEATLASGETITLDPTWITPPCGTEPGIHNIMFTAVSAMSGKIAEEEIELDVLRCHDVEITGDSFAETCEGREVTAALTVTNLGKITETFTLSTESGWATVSPDRITLDPWETGTMQVKMTPGAGFVGEEEIAVKAVSTTTYAEDTKKIDLVVSKCYQFSADVVPPEDVICMGESGEYYVYIDNEGTKADTYRIVTPAWARADEDSITVSARERGSIKITATPSEVGDIPLSVYISSETRPTEVLNAESLLKSLDCRDAVVTIDPPLASVCIGEGTEYTVRVENNGNVDTAYELDATIGSSLSRQKIVLGPGEAQHVILTIEATEKAGTFPVTVDAYVDDVPVDADAATLEVRICYDAGLTVRPNDNDACRGDLLTFDVIVKNNGEYTDTYELRYPGAEENFELESGETMEFTAEIEVTDEWEEISEIPFLLQSSNGVKAEKFIVQNVTPDEICYAVDLVMVKGEEAKEGEVTAQIGYGSPLEMKVTNTGTRRDVFVVSLDGPEWAYISDASVELEAGEEKMIYLYVSPGYETEEDSYQINILTESEKSFSGVAVDAAVVEELPAEAEDTGSMVLEGGVTGMFAAVTIPMEITLISMLAFFTALLVVLRFVVFR